MFYYLISIIGQFIGLLLGFNSPEELKQGEKYFNILLDILLLTIIVTSIIFYFDIKWVVVGILVGIFIRYEYFYFGIISASFLSLGINNLVNSVLIFMYGLPYGTLKFYKKEYKILFLNLVLFLIPFILYLFKFNIASLGTGALMAILVVRLKRFIVKQK